MVESFHQCKGTARRGDAFGVEYQWQGKGIDDRVLGNSDNIAKSSGRDSGSFARLIRHTTSDADHQ